MMNDRVDFVFIGHINTENRSKLLDQTLRSFVRYTNPKFIGWMNYVDDNSPIKYVIQTDHYGFYRINNDQQLGVGGSKNKGADDIFYSMRKDGSPIRNKYVYFSDSDVYFTENWLDKLLEAYSLFNTFESLKLGILGGGCHPFLGTNKVYTSEPYTIHTKDAVSGWSWLTTWDIWEKYGKLFDNSIGSGKSEDWEYCQRVKKDGYEVASIYPEVVFHTGISNTEGLPCAGAEFFPRLPGVLYL